MTSYFVNSIFLNSLHVLPHTLVKCEVVFVCVKAICISMSLNMFVTFLTSGLQYVNVTHLCFSFPTLLFCWEVSLFERYQFI